MIRLYDDQLETVDKIRQAYRGGAHSPLLVAPCAFGKTIIFSYMARAHVEKGGRVMILVHRQELLDQVSQALGKFGVRHSFVAPGYSQDRHERVQVASVFTLIRRLGQVIAPTLIIVDEAHHCVGHTTFGKVIQHFKGARVFGVTATPFRLSGEGLNEYFDRLVLGPTVEELIEKGRLSRFRVFCPSAPDLSGVHKRTGDFVTRELETVVDRPTLTGDAVTHYRRHASGRQAVAFCVSVQHAKHVADNFLAAGFAAQCIDGSMPNEWRREVIGDFRSGRLKILTSCDLVSEGFDVPNIEVGISLRPTMSLGLWLQQCLDEKTEILTPSGWSQTSKVGDMVAAYDITSGSIKWTSVMEVVRRPLSNEESMYGISSPHLDIRVTGGHEMVYRANSGTSKKWRTETAASLSKRIANIWRLPVCGLMEFKGVPLTESELHFIGWFLTDGTLAKDTKQISISQAERKKEERLHIEKCLTACGFKFGITRSVRKGEYAHCSPSINYRISYGLPRKTQKHLTGWARLAKYIGKHWPESLNEMTRKQLLAVLYAMNLGDGTRADYGWRRHTLSITCGDNKILADRIQSACVLRGIRCNTVVHHYGKSPWHILYINSDRMHATVGGFAMRDRSKLEVRPSAKGETVWCVSNELGTLITRRNGKVAIIGNCGRCLRTAPGKTEAILFDHAGNALRHGLPTDEREYSLEGTRGARQGERVPSVRICRKCFAANKSTTMTCVSCGTAFEAKPREVAKKQGELEELTPEQMAALAERRKTGMAKSLQSLIELGRMRGYSSPERWAEHVWRGRELKKQRKVNV